MKSLLSFIIVFTISGSALFSQCPEQQPASLTTLPNNCNQAIVLTPYILNCQDVCFSSTGATTSTGVSDLSCFGGSNTNDVWLTAPNPYNTVTGYDGSLVFRWINWPNKANGIPHPNISIHAEIAGTAGGGIVTINIDCTSPAPTQSNNFAQENAFCIQNSTTAGNQFYGIAGTIPRVQDIPPPSGVTLSNIQYYLQVAPADGSRGNYCFDISTYKQGFLCGDALPLALSGTSGTRTGSTSGCLCSSALNGTIFSNPSNSLPVPCGVESPASVWYSLTLPFACNKVTIEVNQWGGTGNYNVALLSGVNCPGTTGINPYTGATINTPGQTLQPGAVVEGSACGQTLNLCRTLSAGTYHVYLSGASERPTYALNVTVQEVVASIGTVSSPQNNQSVCSASTVELNSIGAATPLSGSCGQNILWYISTNLNFNPYNNQGSLLGSGTGTQNFPLLQNNTCSPATYYIKGIISDNGTTPQSGCKQTSNTITVTIYPEIGQLTLLNQPCIISAAARCPSFIINGQAGTAQVIGNFSMDGQPVTFTVSNGLAGCELIATDTMHCAGNCDQPVATGTLFCDTTDTYNFYVDVDFIPGSAFSYTIASNDGLELLVFNLGTYRMGPFTNGTTVSISVTNTEDANCNIPLGNFTSDCNPVSCPNLTSVSATLAGGGNQACEGATVALTATVDQGVLNQDYKIQWLVNGKSIAGAITLNYSYVTNVADNCSAELQTYSATITCLKQNASPSQTPQMSASGNVNIFPVPVLGIDFVPSPVNCTVAPVDNCNGLSVIYSPTTNPLPGATNTTVNYTVKVTGAPSGCDATGTYVIQCPPSGCGSSSGNGVTPADNVVCSGQQFLLSATGVNLDNGYSLGYAWTTTNPYGNLEQAVQNAITNNRFLGPYAVTATPSFTNNGSTFPYGTYYFIPFTALNIPANLVANTQSGTITVAALFGTGTASINVPSTVAYCAGVTTYTALLTAQQQSNTLLLNAINSVTGSIVSYSGNATTTVTLNNNNFAGDPRGTTTTINASGNLIFGSDINYIFTLRHNAVAFPTRCTTCPDFGNPVVLKLLPPINLSPPALPQICSGESVELTDYNPIANIPGTFTWYNGNPAIGGTVIQNTMVIPTSNGSTYWALFRASDDSTCTATTSINIVPNVAPTVNQLAPPAPVCTGTTVDLTALNNSITTSSGTIIWYRGNPQNNPAAVRLLDAVAASQQPTNGSHYCAKFTNSGTGCFSFSCVTFTVNPKPALTAPAVDPISCEGNPFDLNTLEPGLTSATGTFIWFEGDPDTGGIQLTPQQETHVVPTPGSLRYCTIFTDNVTNCENKICLKLNITPLPVLNRLPQQGPFCSSEALDLTALQPQINSDNGTWQWADENGSAVTSPSEVFAQQSTFYKTSFTNSLTGCSDTVSVYFEVNLSPALNAPIVPPVCTGAAIDLTVFESQMQTSSGTLTWYKGDTLNLGVALTLAQSQQQLPTSIDVYNAVFENAFGCTDTQTIQFTVNASPVLNNFTAQKACSGIPQDLTALNDSATSAPGTFVWYLGISTAGTPLTNTEAQSQTITGIVSYTVKFTDANGCSANKTVVYTGLAEVGGATAQYNCTLDKLVVNLSGASGGAGAGYAVASNSPNQNGETLPNGSNWTVLVSDSLGCTQTLTGTVSCIVCAMGNATAAQDTACCNTTLHLEAEGIVTSPGYAVAWGLSPVSSGPINSLNGVNAAASSGYVWQAKADGSFDFINQCPDIPSGDYYFTPFIIEDPVAAPLVYDTLNFCTPDGQICPTLSNSPDWTIDTLMGVFPNGDTVDLVRQLTEALLAIPGGLDIDIDQSVLNSFFQGVLPCFQLTNLFAGDPNGSWAFIINNIGTGPLAFTVPDFIITVEADSCAALNGIDQVVVVPGTSITIPPNGQFYSITFQFPPLPSSFPAVNPACEAYGNAVQLYITNDLGLCVNNIDERNKVIATLHLVPNPAMDRITINATLLKSEDISVTAIDIFGKETPIYISSEKVKRFEQTLDISPLAAGVYLFRIKAGNEIRNLKLVKL